MGFSSDFLIGLAIGSVVIAYTLNSSSKTSPKKKENRRYTIEDLSRYTGEEFRSCLVSLDGDVYDVSKDKQRFINAKLGGQCLNHPENLLSLREEFVSIGLSREDIKSFTRVGSLLLMKDFTVEELKKYDGSGDKPAYICANGSIYDVDKSFYGPEGPYGCFAGRDASRALAKVSLEKEDLENTNLDDLTFNEKHTLNDWIAKFESKYTKVGYLK